jgi:ATP-binding cassette subfamily B protein/subfamily B ATP-binding cassette protein MsbA
MLAFLFVLTVLAAGLNALQPVPLKWLADNVLGNEPVPTFLQFILKTFSLKATPQAILYVVVLGGLVVFALSSALDAALTWAWTFMGRRMVYDLAQDLFAQLQRRSLLFHSRNPVGDNISRITGDSWCVYQAVDSLLFAPVHAILITVAMTIIMLRLDPKLTVIALITAPLMTGASMLAGKQLRAAAKTRREIESKIQSHLQQTLAGMPVVQAFGQEEREQNRFQEFTEASIRIQKRSVLIGSFNTLSSGLIATIGSGLIVWVGALQVRGGELGVGSLLIFVYYLNVLQEQFKVFAGLYTTAQNLTGNADHVRAVLEARPEIPDMAEAAALPAIRGHVSIEDVTVGYAAGEPVLRKVSVEALPGQTIAIVGPTGAGKSTLVSLLPRFLDPWSGRVLIDGKDLRQVRLQTVRAQVGMVLQEPFLFPFSVADNIAYGKPGASREEIVAAARSANAHDYIVRLPQGYDTILGEHGGTISGGERQRLAIARALLKDAPILILDEPTSALDSETEELLLEALDRLLKGRTTFIVAHRFSTIRRADRIVALQEGIVVEQGPHDELLRKEGYYARLHQLQFQDA